MTIFQKFIYDPGSGSVTLQPTYPATGKLPVDMQAATRHDSLSSDGHRQSVIERIDALQTLVFPVVPASDLTLWANFFAFALTGAAFDYYADASLSSHASYELVDESWQYSRMARGHYTFTLQMRRHVA